MRARFLLSISLSLVAASGCQLLGGTTYRATVSGETAGTLNRISSVLEDRGAEVRFRCSDADDSGRSDCRIEVQENRQPELDAQVLDEPFTNNPMVLRIAGGTEALTGGLYESLGDLTSTNDFQGQLDERKLLLENGKIEIRCTATREAAPSHRCWTLIRADLLR